MEEYTAGEDRESVMRTSRTRQGHHAQCRAADLVDECRAAGLR